MGRSFGVGDITLVSEDTDSDGDGVDDESDNCPATANTDQANFDGDLFGDACDADDDNDGVADDADAFPYDPDRAVSCEPGSFGAFSCQPAPAGSFVASEGATEATPCPVGTLSNEVGAVECQRAPVGTYVNAEGATEPTPCPAGETTAGIGSVSGDACFPIDADGDGVPDVDDLCVGTEADPAPEQLKKNRNWPDPTETFGCSASQIIADAGLGAGHARFGISNSSLADWIDGLG